MAARIRLKHQDEVRARIQASQLINRLTDHALGNLEKPMDPSQVTAALGLLRKSIPDLSATEHKGEMTYRTVRETPEQELERIIAGGSGAGASDEEAGAPESTPVH